VIKLRNKLLPFFIVTLLVILFLGYLQIKGQLNQDIFSSIVYGYLFTSFNFLLSLISLHYGIGKDSTKFLLIVLGGMTFRMFFMLILIIIAILYLKISQYYFIFTTFILYLFYLVAEIYFTIKTDKKVYKY